MFKFINKSMTSHFGKKPRNGGSPPKESKGIKITVFIKNLKLNEEKI